MNNSDKEFLNTHYISYGDYDRLEGKLIDLGFVRTSSSAITDLEQRIDAQDRVIMELMHRTVTQKMAFQYLLMNKITGYTIDKGDKMTIHLRKDDESESLDPPTILNQIEDIIREDTRELESFIGDDHDQPWH